MAELEKSTEAAAQQTALQTRSTNVHGDQIQVVTTTQYEQQTFSSKTDWRVRAISVSIFLLFEDLFPLLTTSL
jgi:pre-mRNA-processing factor 8